MNTLKWVVTGGILIIIISSGHGLSRLGRPYNGLLFNAHKLLALAAVVLFVITLVRINRTTPLGAAWALGALVGFFVLGLFITGALHSIQAQGGLGNLSQSAQAAIRLVHRLFPYLAAASGVLTLLLLKA